MAIKTPGSPVTVEWVKGEPPAGIGVLKVGKTPVLDVSINEKKREFRVMLYDNYWRIIPIPRKSLRTKRPIDKVDAVNIVVKY